MKVSKWVDFGQDVEVEIGLDDVRCALSEAFDRVTQDESAFGGEPPNRNDVILALQSIGLFLKVLTDEQIALLNQSQRSLVAGFLADHATRFAVGGLFVTDSRFKAAPQT